MVIQNAAQILFDEIVALRKEIALLRAEIKAPNKKEILYPIDVEKEYGLKRTTQANYRSRGKLPYRKQGGKVFYKRSELEAFILENSERF